VFTQARRNPMLGKAARRLVLDHERHIRQQRHMLVAALSIAADAPEGLRIAATITSVSSTRLILLI
jgi:hypothetical protein